MPLLVHAVAGALAVHGEAVELAGEADGEIGDVDHLLHFALAFGQDFAHFEADEGAEVVFVGAEFVGDLAHDFAAFGCGRHAPFEEGFLGARDDVLVVVEAGHANAGERLVVGGIDGDQFGAGGIRNPIAPAGAGIQRLDVELLEQGGNRFEGGHDFIVGRGRRETCPRNHTGRNSIGLGSGGRLRFAGFRGREVERFQPVAARFRGRETLVPDFAELFLPLALLFLEGLAQ